MKKKYAAYAAVIIVVVIAAVLAKNNLAGGAKKEAIVPSPTSSQISVKTIKAKVYPVSPGLSYDASLEASDEGTISNKVGGNVTAVNFEDGQRVKQGDVLAKIDDTDIRNNIASTEAQLASAAAQLKVVQSQYDSAKISLNTPKTNLQTAQNNYNRTKELYAQGGVAMTDLETADSQLKNAKTTYDAALQNLEASKLGIETQKANLAVTKTSLNNLMNSLKKTAITAPISGVVDSKNVNVGQYLNVGTVIGKVKNSSPIYAEIKLNESDLSYIKQGDKALFKLNEGDTVSYTGTVKSIDGAADPASRQFGCKIEISNADGKLKPGVFGSVSIASGYKKNSVMLPLSAVGGSDGSYYIFVDESGKAVKRSITTGEIVNNMIEVKSGVQSGESIISSNLGTLQDGETIKVVSE